MKNLLENIEDWTKHSLPTLYYVLQKTDNAGEEFVEMVIYDHPDQGMTVKVFQEITISPTDVDYLYNSIGKIVQV